MWGSELSVSESPWAQILASPPQAVLPPLRSPSLASSSGAGSHPRSVLGKKTDGAFSRPSRRPAEISQKPPQVTCSFRTTHWQRAGLPVDQSGRPAAGRRGQAPAENPGTSPPAVRLPAGHVCGRFAKCPARALRLRRPQIPCPIASEAVKPLNKREGRKGSEIPKDSKQRSVVIIVMLAIKFF